MDAVLPLIGVVVGAILGGGVTFALERTRERRSARAAALLVQEELHDIWTTLDVAILAFGGATVGPGGDPEWKTAEWQAHRGLLAAGMSPEAWRQVAAAYRGLRFVPKGPQTQGRPRRARTSDRPRPTRSHPSKRVIHQREQIAEAINALEADVGLPLSTFNPSELGPELPPEMFASAARRDAPADS
jgi:hypothetical protein